MHLHALDWAIVAFTLFICFFPALFFGKLAGRNTSEFFASGRSVPWWLVGAAIVFAFIVSLVSGLYPAARAARLDPVQALRYE